MFFLGFLSGIVFCVLMAIMQFRYEPDFKRAEQKIKNISSQKGAILEDEQEKAIIVERILKEHEL